MTDPPLPFSETFSTLNPSPDLSSDDDEDSNVLESFLSLKSDLDDIYTTLVLPSQTEQELLTVRTEEELEFREQTRADALEATDRPTSSSVSSHRLSSRGGGSGDVRRRRKGGDDASGDSSSISPEIFRLHTVSELTTKLEEKEKSVETDLARRKDALLQLYASKLDLAKELRQSQTNLRFQKRDLDLRRRRISQLEETEGLLREEETRTAEKVRECRFRMRSSEEKLAAEKEKSLEVEKLKAEIGQIEEKLARFEKSGGRRPVISRDDDGSADDWVEEQLKRLEGMEEEEIVEESRVLEKTIRKIGEEHRVQEKKMTQIYDGLNGLIQTLTEEAKALEDVLAPGFDPTFELGGDTEDEELDEVMKFQIAIEVKRYVEELLHARLRRFVKPSRRDPDHENLERTYADLVRKSRLLTTTEKFPLRHNVSSVEVHEWLADEVSKLYLPEYDTERFAEVYNKHVIAGYSLQHLSPAMILRYIHQLKLFECSDRIEKDLYRIVAEIERRGIAAFDDFPDAPVEIDPPSLLRIVNWKSFQFSENPADDFERESFEEIKKKISIIKQNVVRNWFKQIVNPEDLMNRLVTFDDEDEEDSIEEAEIIRRRRLERQRREREAAEAAAREEEKRRLEEERKAAKLEEEGEEEEEEGEVVPERTETSLSRRRIAMQIEEEGGGEEEDADEASSSASVSQQEPPLASLDGGVLKEYASQIDSIRHDIQMFDESGQDGVEEKKGDDEFVDLDW